MNNTLTIVYSAYQSHNLLNKVIRKLPKKYKILIIENSLDKNLKNTLEKKYKNVEVIIPEKNLGLAKSYNLGLKKAKTKVSSDQINSSAFHIVCDAEQIPCESGSVDAVIIVAALHHLPSPEAFFKEVNRVLKSGGLLVVGFEPNTWPYFFIYPLCEAVISQ